MWLLNLLSMRKKQQDKILRNEPKEQHLITIPKSYSLMFDGTYKLVCQTQVSKMCHITK